MTKSQQRYRIRQKERWKAVEEEVAQLTAELEASRLGQVLPPSLIAGRDAFVQHSGVGQKCWCSKPSAILCQMKQLAHNWHIIASQGRLYICMDT